MGMKIEKLENIWKFVLKDLKKQITDNRIFDTWFNNSYLQSLNDGTAVIVVNSKVAKTGIVTSCLDELSLSLNKVTESNYLINIITKDDNSFKLDKGEKTYTFFQNSFLLNKYTFNNFVTGKSNKEAYEAAKYIAMQQGSYNPLFIYSDSGLGKTHLLQAIGNFVKANNPNKKVLYITADNFVDEFLNYIHGDSDKNSLKDFFRTIDYLLVDDIQFLAGKTATEKMFFTVFNILHELGKQIVLSSDRPPIQLEGIEDRLVSRFSQGLSVSIDKPEKQTLIEILKLKIKANGFDINKFDEDALDFLAYNNSQNIRALEGSLNRVFFLNVTTNNCNQITLEMVKKAFNKDIESLKENEKLSPTKIISTVAKYYNLTENQLLSNVRTSQIAFARQIGMYLCRTLLDCPYTTIAAAFNKKDHTTVISAVKKVDNLVKTDELTKKVIKQFNTQLKA